MTLPIKKPFHERLIRLILKPGDWICQLFKMEDTEQRHFLRLYLNLFLYTKLAVLVAVYLAIYCGNP